MASETHQNGYARIRKRTAELVFSVNRESRASRLVDTGLMLLISLNVMAVVLESVEPIRLAAPNFFFGFEVFSVTIFTLEYFARVWAVVDDSWRPEYQASITGRLRYMFTWMAIIDLLAIAPFYLAMFAGADLRVLRALRLLRIFKLTRYSSAMTLLIQVFREDIRTIMAAMFVCTLLVFMASSLAYLFEHAAQPETFSSIPASMYWAVITMTSVGYGDMVPITSMGKLLGAAIGVMGLGMVALPAGIIASGFNNALHRRRAMLKERVEDAMEDGMISEKEQEDLDALMQRLNLNEIDAKAIQNAVQHERKKSSRSKCPHCGKNADSVPSS